MSETAATDGVDPMAGAVAGEQPMVRIDGVTKRFGDMVAVDEASFQLGAGQFLTILGPSGSGKTTLLRMIAGFLEPDAGEIYLRGKQVSRLAPNQRSIGMVFQRLALFPHMTAAENVAYPLKMRRFDAVTIKQRVEEYLQLVRLDGLGKRRIQQLSGGQQQRVAIARALVFQPDLLLLDEPLSSLDKKLREELEVEFRNIQQEIGVTTINVTHDQREALVMSDQVIVINESRIQQAASPAQTYGRPANRFVAGFIGTTNFLSGQVAAVDDERVTLEVAGAALTGRCLSDAPVAGDATECALRAEQIHIVDDGATQGAAADAVDVTFDGTVSAVIFEGHRMVYTVVCPQLGGLSLHVFDPDPGAGRMHASGDNVVLGWRSRDLMIFPASR